MQNFASRIHWKNISNEIRSTWALSSVGPSVDRSILLFHLKISIFSKTSNCFYLFFHQIPICKHQFDSTVNKIELFTKVWFFLPFDRSSFFHSHIFLRRSFFSILFFLITFSGSILLFAEKFFQHSVSEKNSIWFDAIVHFEIGAQFNSLVANRARSRTSRFSYIHDAQVALYSVPFPLCIFFLVRGITVFYWNSLSRVKCSNVECQNFFDYSIVLAYCWTIWRESKKSEFHPSWIIAMVEHILFALKI